MASTHYPIARVSHVRLFTDMSRKSAPAIPLAVFMEVVWPAKGRWFGVLGRDHITPDERQRISPSEFPKMNNPWQFLTVIFEKAWTKKQENHATGWRDSIHGIECFSPECATSRNGSACD